MSNLRNLKLWLGLASGAAPALPDPTPGGTLAVTEAGFSLHLAGDWVSHPTGDPEQWRFESRARRTVVAVSVVKAAIPQSRLLAAVSSLANIRRHADGARRASRKIRFGDHWAELDPAGQSGHAAYAARDEETIIKFMGWATTRKLLSLTVETSTRDDTVSARVFDEVFAGFGFYTP